MNVSTVSRRRLATLGALVLPVAVAACAKLLGLGPAFVDGANARDDATSLTAQSLSDASVPRMEFSDVAMEATRYAAELRRESLAPNPFHYTFQMATPEPERPKATIPKAPTNPLDALELTGIMGGREPIVVINGELRRVGDEIITGWKVSHIDAESRVVTLTHESGDTYALKALP